jgi:hypothetical protein
MRLNEGLRLRVKDAVMKPRFNALLMPSRAVKHEISACNSEISHHHAP